MRRRAAILVCTPIVASAAWLTWPRPDTGATSLPASVAAVHPRSAQLAEIRCSMDPPRLERFIAEQTERAESGRDPGEWRVLGEAHLERVLLASSSFGMAVAKPTFATIPDTVSRHLDAGERAVAQARLLGDTHSEVARIEAGLKANRMTGMVAAMRIGREVERLIEEAANRDSGNPHVAVMRGCRLLFTPKWLGGDPQRALPLFEAAASRLPHDERPLVFAAFAAHLLGDTPRALALLRDATRRTPANRYAREVLRRLEAGEDRVFERDVDG